MTLTFGINNTRNTNEKGNINVKTLLLQTLKNTQKLYKYYYQDF